MVVVAQIEGPFSTPRQDGKDVTQISHEGSVQIQACKHARIPVRVLQQYYSYAARCTCTVYGTYRLQETVSDLPRPPGGKI